MRCLTLVFAVLTIAPAGGLLARAQDKCRGEALPPPARLLINKRFPGWRVKLPSDLVDFDKEAWLQAHPEECPGMAVGTFEMPNLTGYGLLLVPNSGADTGYKIVILSKSANASGYSVSTLDHAEGQPRASSGLVISRVPPGRYSGFDMTQSVQLKLDEIEAEWIEKSSVLFYWKNGKYRTLQTSD